MSSHTIPYLAPWPSRVRDHIVHLRKIGPFRPRHRCHSWVGHQRTPACQGSRSADMETCRHLYEEHLVRDTYIGENWVRVTDVRKTRSPGIGQLTATKLADHRPAYDHDNDIDKCASRTVATALWSGAPVLHYATTVTNTTETNHKTTAHLRNARAMAK